MISIPLDGLGLAGTRQEKGITLEQISQQTKLKVSTLRAIEEGHFERLPGGVYNMSYIRQFARAIGLDEAPIIERYLMRTARNKQR